MIRTFKFTVEGPFSTEVESEITIDDSEYGMSWTVDSSEYRLSTQNIRDLKEILAQVELPVT